MHDAREGTKCCNRLRRNDNKVSLVTDNDAPNLRYKDCSGWHADCTINLGSGSFEEQGRQMDLLSSPRARGKGPYV